ncbi:MAG: GTPase (G3E family) [Ruminococcus sp.]|nr:GTPase (G3E family) [Ruminococcus sp.]
MTKIDLITGILGSGKTTFLRHYAKHLLSQGKRIAILENDFGAVNVDMMMLRDLQGDNCQLAMITGGGDPDCHKRRFRTQLITLGMQGFDRVIVEPSGIYDMDEFFDTLHESPIDRWFEAGTVLTIIDSGMKDLSEQMDYLLASEAACCGKLVVSKIKEYPPDTDSLLARINCALENISCTRRFTEKDMFIKDWEELSPADMDSLLNAGYRTSAYVKRFAPDMMSSSVHYFMHLDIPEDMIDETISSILSDKDCGKIFRIKGALPTSNGILKINATPEKTEVSPVNSGQALLIVIGDDLCCEKISSHLQKVNNDPKYVCI